MTAYSEGDEIDPVAENLDKDTIIAVQHAVEGFSTAQPDQSPTEMSDFREGKHRAYSNVIALLGAWLGEIEKSEEEDD